MPHHVQAGHIINILNIQGVSLKTTPVIFYYIFSKLWSIFYKHYPVCTLYIRKCIFFCY